MVSGQYDKRKNATYLGDGAFVKFEYGSFVIFTHDGYSEKNVVTLGTFEAQELVKYIKEKMNHE